jgi:hypothetical protein
MDQKPHGIKTDKTLGEFKAWLKSLPPGTKFCESLRICSCPIAKFTGVETWLLDIPRWAERFMDRFDRESNMRNDTVERAIEIADTL